MTPENNGRFLSTKGAFGYGSKSKITLADMADFSSSIVDEPTASESDGVYALAEISLIPMIDIFYGPTGPGAKVQVWGEATDKAKPGNISIAVAIASEEATNKDNASYGSGTTTSSSNSTYTLEGAAKYQFVDRMLLLGYRSSVNNLIYINITSNTFKARGSVEQRVSENGLTTVTTLETPNYQGRENSVLLGLQRSFDTFFWMLEPGYSTVRVTSNDFSVQKNRFTLGGTLGFKF
jgi:hypothetical protein